MDAHEDPTSRGGAQTHALLIGIDRFPFLNKPLNGCVNDVDAVQELLIKRMRVPTGNIRRLTAPFPDPTIVRPTVVPNGDPTRANIVAALRELATRVGAEDRVFVFASGHGAQREVVSRGSRFHREALVPMDADPRLPGEGLLFDWELQALMANISARTASVTVVLDCCNSAGATREGVASARGEARRYPPPENAAPYALPDDALPVDEQPATRGMASRLGRTFGAAMVVAACGDAELAREFADDAGKYHGALTRSLLEVLRGFDDARLKSLRWGEIWHALAAKVDAANPQQHPWFSGGLARRVFGGPPAEGDVGIRVVESEEGVYTLGAGSLHDVSDGALVAVYPPMPDPLSFGPLGEASDLAKRLGVLRVEASNRASATALRDASSKALPTPLPLGARGRLIRPGKGGRLRFAVKGNDAALVNRLRASAFVEVVDAGGVCDAMLVPSPGEPGAWEIDDELYGPPDAKNPTVAQSLPRLPRWAVEKPAPTSPEVRDPVVAYVDHYVHFTAPIRLARRCDDVSGALQISLLDASGVKEVIPEAQRPDPPLPLLQPTGEGIWDLRAARVNGAGELASPVRDAYIVRVYNGAEVPLKKVWLFLCDDGGAAWLECREEVVQPRAFKVLYPGRIGPGVPTAATLPIDRPRGADRLVAIGTTDEGASLDSLEVPYGFGDVLKGGPRGSVSAVGVVHHWVASIAVLRLST